MRKMANRTNHRGAGPAKFGQLPDRRGVPPCGLIASRGWALDIWPRRTIKSRSLSEKGGGLLRGRGSGGKIGGNGLENVNSLRRTSRSAFHQFNMDVFGCGPPRESVVHRIGCRQRRLLSLLGQVWSRPHNGRAGRRSMSRRARPPRPAASVSAGLNAARICC